VKGHSTPPGFLAKFKRLYIQGKMQNGKNMEGKKKKVKEMKKKERRNRYVKERKEGRKGEALSDEITSNLSKANDTRDSLAVPVCRLSTCPSLSLAMSAQFALKICATAENCKKR